MSDPVENVQELARLSAINDMKAYFREPGQIAWGTVDIEKMKKLYDIAVQFDPNNPLGWVRDFNASHSFGAEIGVETTRLGKILAFAEIYLKTKKDEAKFIKQVPVRREF